MVDRPVFAFERVRYVGEPVVGVVAISEEIAEEAARKVEIEYEELDPLFDPLEAARPGAILIHPDMDKYKVENFIFPVPGTNISEHFKVRKGDVKNAWDQCERIVSQTYKLPPIQHVPLETHIGVALWERSGKVTLWASTQSPFSLRSMIAKCLQIPHGDLRVIAPYVGGGFGGKAGVSMEVCSVAIAKYVKGHPVRLRMTRQEEFVGTTTRQSMISNIKIGCDSGW
jgi:CO/xanthine dehydrogenase Mo-binding subunit